MNGCILCWSGRRTCDLCVAIERELLFATWMWGGIGVMCFVVFGFMVGVCAGWW